MNSTSQKYSITKTCFEYKVLMFIKNRSNVWHLLIVLATEVYDVIFLQWVGI